MPGQIIPINNLSEIGLIEDTPSVSLPPNAFSDCQNVRFRDGAVRKMRANSDFLTNIGLEGIRLVAHWPAPSGNKFVVIDTISTNTTISVWREDGSQIVQYETTAGEEDSNNWNYTLFNGGFHIILNSTVGTPWYLTDAGDTPTGSSPAQRLPGWASYATQELSSDFVYDGDASNFTITDPRFVAGANIRFTITPRNTANPLRTTVLTVNSDSTGFVGDGTVEGLGTSTISGNTITFTPAASAGGSQVQISIVGDLVSNVTAGVIRAYGNLLVAGNLVENSPSGTRTLTGIIRTSDVAGPGNIPMNWNPFAIGVNTADEFILASTGTIQDMAELQGVLYVYTDSSIHAIQQTQSPIVPFQITPVTESYGCDNTDGVLEVDGKHIVFGSDDVYVFAGHPGSIQSIADGRVRDFFREATDIRILRFNRWDELWFWTPSGQETYIWNYRNNTWTKRSQTSGTVAGTSTQSDLFFGINDGTVYRVDYSSDYLNAYVERRRLTLTPEFDTETLASMALLIDGSDNLTINAVGSNAPGLDVDPTTSPPKDFTIADEYKQDIRVHGRFLNYRMSHNHTSNICLLYTSPSPRDS